MIDNGCNLYWQACESWHQFTQMWNLRNTKSIKVMFNCVQQVSFSFGKLNILSSNLAHISMGEFHKDQHMGKWGGKLFSNLDGKYCGI